VRGPKKGRFVERLATV